MCKDLKKEIDLTFSLNRLIKEHDILTKITINKSVRKVEIMKNSRFNILDKYLPSDFERIKSK